MKLGDTVRVRPTYRYAAEWRGEFIVTAMRLLPNQTVDVTIADDTVTRSGGWLGATDGFMLEDLEVVKEAAPRAE